MPEESLDPCECEELHCDLAVGFTGGYDAADNRTFERHLHNECRSHLYPNNDSANRLRTSERGRLEEPGSGQDVPPGIDPPIALPGSEAERNITLDAAGNWSAVAYTSAGTEHATTFERNHNPLNQITGSRYAYDANGNLLSDGQFSYAYDAFNRLRQVRQGARLLAEYFYDALGRRIRKVTRKRDGAGESVIPTQVGSTVRMRYDSLDRVLETSQSTGPRTRHVTTPEMRSYQAHRLDYPAHRQIQIGHDALYRRQSLQETAGGIAGWQFYGPHRLHSMSLGNQMQCLFGSGAGSQTAVQPGVPRPSWGDACSDHLGYDGAGRLIGKRYFGLPDIPPEELFAIEITGSSPIADYPNRWNYQWKKVVPALTGGGQFMDASPGITHETPGYGMGYNTIEANNREQGVQGSGDNTSGLPDGIALKPIGLGAIVIDARIIVNCAGETEVHFSAPNNIGGECDDD